MLDPLAAPDALSAAVEPLEDLLQDNTFQPFIELLHVVPATGTTAGRDRMQVLAQAVFDAGGWGSGYQVGGPVRPFASPRAWRDIFRGQVTEGYMRPARRYGHTAPDRHAPDDIRRAGELADGIADLVEAHLGPVRGCGDVGGPHTSYIWWRNLLLVTDDWATVLHLAVSD
ncbi:hypothetical protein ACFWP2_23660 [Kitasatospora sp. NPDC058444]|uniref:hypothetical protein n=1 Tax=Kitasatospora sp. NPDC058444 TaxID=3346504 RepID=UPI003658257F